MLVCGCGGDGCLHLRNATARRDVAFAGNYRVGPTAQRPSTRRSLTMDWIARCFRVPASETQKTFLLVICVVAMSVMAVGLVWQAEIIADHAKPYAGSKPRNSAAEALNSSKSSGQSSLSATCGANRCRVTSSLNAPLKFYTLRGGCDSIRPGGNPKFLWSDVMKQIVVIFALTLAPRFRRAKPRTFSRLGSAGQQSQRRIHFHKATSHDRHARKHHASGHHHRHRSTAKSHSP